MNLLVHFHHCKCWVRGCTDTSYLFLGSPWCNVTGTVPILIQIKCLVFCIPNIATTDKLHPTAKYKITTINFNMVYENSLSIFFYKILKRQFESFGTNLYKFMEEKFSQKLSPQRYVVRWSLEHGSSMMEPDDRTWTMINLYFSTTYTKMVYRMFWTKKYILSSVNLNIKWTDSNSVSAGNSSWVNKCSNYPNSNILNSKLYFIYKNKTLIHSLFISNRIGQKKTHVETISKSPPKIWWRLFFDICPFRTFP